MQLQQCAPACAAFAVRRVGMFFCLLTAFISFASFNQKSSAQAVYGSVVGTVTDATGAVIPGDRVEIERAAGDLGAPVDEVRP